MNIKKLSVNKLNNYYHKDLEEVVSRLIPTDATVVEFSSNGKVIAPILPNKIKVCVKDNLPKSGKTYKKYKNLRLLDMNEWKNKLKNKRFDYILLNHSLSNENDVEYFVKSLKRICNKNTRVIAIYSNFLWKPALDLAEMLGQKVPKIREPNWLTDNDIENFFNLADYEKICSGSRFIFPFNFPIVSFIFNKILSHLPLADSLCLTKYAIFRPRTGRSDYSVSIIIPARNEKGNIKEVFKKIPNLGTKTEAVFVEGNSQDGTFQKIKDEIGRYKGSVTFKLFKQNGIGKGDAVRLGFSNAKNDILLIFDADLTVPPEDLHKFYDAIASNRADLVIGSRLVYPMEKQAMRFLNYIGNRFFSVAFTFVLGQRIKDTLCGTKALLKSSYIKIKKNRTFFGDFDPFGDFDLLFGATKLNFKIVEIPIRYRERSYGKSNISRFSHGTLLLKMLFFAAFKLKFY